MFLKILLSIAVALALSTTVVSPPIAEAQSSPSTKPPTCRYETRKVWTGYGWQYKKVRVCDGKTY